MESYHAMVEAASRWIDRVAATIVEAIDCFRPKRLFRLVEQQNGTFVLQVPGQGEPQDWCGKPIRISDGRIDAAISAQLETVLRGAEVELVLLPKYFMFRLLELPRRASVFLDGIVRAQIDRLTPWSLTDAAFGWHPSAEPQGDRLTVMIAATARTLVAPFVNAVSSLGVDLVSVAAALDEPRPAVSAIKILEHKAGQATQQRRIRRLLIGVLGAAGVLSAVSSMASAVGGSAIEAQHEELMARIAERRAAIQSGKASAAVLDLERRKHEVPSSVIVIEALSRILPDDTYLTELRIVGDKVQIVGMTRDAPTLIRLLEHTSHFKRATFFSPTTRSKTESAEHFSIEAHIEPVFALE